MADDFASSFLRSFSAAQDIRGRREDREWLREQRARQRKEDGRQDKYRKDVAGIASGERQTAIDPETQTVSASIVEAAPSGFTVADVPGTGGIPAPKANMATKLADRVKGKVSELFGGSGGEDVGTFGLPATPVSGSPANISSQLETAYQNEGKGAAPELTANSTSNQLGMTRKMSRSENLRAMAQATAEVSPEQAFKYMQEADKEEVADEFASLYKDAGTNDGAAKAWERYNDGTKLTWKRQEDGDYEYFANDQSVGKYRNARELAMEHLAPMVANMDPAQTLSMVDRQQTHRDRRDDREESRRRYDMDVAFREDGRKMEQQRLSLAEAAANRDGKLNDLQVQTATIKLGEVTKEKDLRTQYGALLKNPIKNRAQLGEIEQQLFLDNPDKYGAAESRLSDPNDLGSPVIRSVSNVLTSRREADMPKIDRAEGNLIKDGLKKSIIKGDVDVNEYISELDSKYGNGAVELMRESDPEFNSLIDAASGKKQSSAQKPAQSPGAQQWGVPSMDWWKDNKD